MYSLLQKYVRLIASQTDITQKVYTMLTQMEGLYETKTLDCSTSASSNFCSFSFPLFVVNLSVLLFLTCLGLMLFHLQSLQEYKKFRAYNVKLVADSINPYCFQQFSASITLLCNVCISLYLLTASLVIDRKKINY